MWVEWVGGGNQFYKQVIGPPEPRHTLSVKLEAVEQDDIKNIFPSYFLFLYVSVVKGRR